MDRSRRQFGLLSVVAILASAAGTVALAQSVGIPAPASEAPGEFLASEAFAFLFLSIGPAHALVGFAALTAHRERAFKRRLALYGTGAAALAILLAATMGVSLLKKWHVSTSALAMAAGLLLLLGALRQLLAAPSPSAPAVPDGPTPRPIDLAFSPLATPTIIPPFGIAVVILLLALARQGGAIPTMCALIGIVLALDLLAMIFADLILKLPAAKYGLLLFGAIMGVLQVALAVHTIANSIRALNIS